MVSSYHATNNAQRPRLDGALPEVVSAPASSDAPDQTVDGCALLPDNGRHLEVQCEKLCLSTRLF